jgi:hypothetical protein
MRLLGGTPGDLGSYSSSALREARVAAAFLAAERRRRVVAAFLPAARRLRVVAAFRPAALCLRVVAAFLAAARRFLVAAAFLPALTIIPSQCEICFVSAQLLLNCDRRTI